MAIVPLVNLMKGGEPVRLSKRTGDIVELREVIDEVGPDKRPGSPSCSSRSTARRPSTWTWSPARPWTTPSTTCRWPTPDCGPSERRATELGVVRAPPSARSTWASSSTTASSTCLRVLSTLPDVVATACADRAPHRIATWVRELAGAVAGFYHDCYVLGGRHRARADPGAAVAGRGGRDRPGHRLGPARGGRP